jgi:hypothetical protein
METRFGPMRAARIPVYVFGGSRVFVIGNKIVQRQLGCGTKGEYNQQDTGYYTGYETAGLHR